MAEANTSDRVVPQEAQGNVKETVESILVAFILAFIFRAFVVEAFVIPTGSMAPTLYGAHMRFVCPDCGYHFDVGYSNHNYPGMETGGSDDDTDVPGSAPQPTDFHCPNCGTTIGRTDGAGNPIIRPVRFGDRILVLKYLYLFQKPVRWDVVVFKSPADREKRYEDDPEYQQNYIKRLIGIGPESIVILDGDIYIGPPGATRPEQFAIQRKPNNVQDALWRNVYDNDFIPQANASGGWVQPWQAAGGSGWTLGRTRIFTFDNTSGGGQIAFNPDANPETHALTDYLTYDEFEHSGARQQWQPVHVSDLKLSCFYRRSAGDGPLRMQLTKSADCFTAEVTRGKVRLLHSRLVSGSTFSTTNETEVASQSIADLSSSDPVHVELTNVDYRVSVRINGAEVISHLYDPDVKALWAQEDNSSPPAGPFERPQVRITADRQSCTLEHVALSRDIYYLSRSYGHFWGTTQRLMHLNPGEYFVLGDNSFISGDARYWNEPIVLPEEGLPAPGVESGRVPQQFMLGKAFFVYWPAGHRLPLLPVNAAPDFGEMRFIR